MFRIAQPASSYQCMPRSTTRKKKSTAGTSTENLGFGSVNDDDQVDMFIVSMSNLRGMYQWKQGCGFGITMYCATCVYEKRNTCRL